MVAIKYKLFADWNVAHTTHRLKERNVALEADGLAKRNQASHHSGSGEDSG